MKNKFLCGILLMSVLTSCVSKKVYTELEDKHTALKKEARQLSDTNDELTAANNLYELDNATLQKSLADCTAERDKLKSQLKSSENNLSTLQSSYAALEKNSDDVLQSNMSKNRELLAELEAKGKKLTAEQDRLNKLKSDLLASSNRLAELESIMAAKDAAMNKLRETLSKALNNFEGKGLSVHQKDGKVYVSMENKLLFQTGSWAVGTEGRKAVEEVAKVLAQNPDISVLIEGHTDNDKIMGTLGSGIESNWDLSTKRATAIVNIITENKQINKQNLTAAGRSEFEPIASNANADGKAKNRRIEIILTPKLDAISKLLNDF
ncbi:OmpA family protein [Flavobacterium ardleyense]|uniref:OmpA family protein n=1 Tax=Flavobacterium ardleyense TaxID=2038737 RepID=UPI00298C0A9E|nr:OmpA family protein [Flavobacterium ardleyense]